MLTVNEPIDLALTLWPLRRGRFDPSIRLDASGFWRATRTPEGLAAVHIARDGSQIVARAWGSGARFALDAAPALLGLDDDPGTFVAHHEVLRRAHRSLLGMRQGRSGAVMEALIPSILEQKVASAEAWRSYASLVRRYGEPAPGPMPLIVPPDPGVLASLPYWAFHPLGIEQKRADIIRRVCANAPMLEALVSLEPGEAQRRMRLLRGIGPWTSAEVARVALGDPDAVSLGDYHLPHIVSWVIVGEPRSDDARMLELLAPYEGQRARAIRLIEHAGAHMPRRAPRAQLRSFSSK